MQASGFGESPWTEGRREPGSLGPTTGPQGLATRLRENQGQRIWVGPAASFPQGTRRSDFGSQLKTTEKLNLLLGSSHNWELLDFYLLLLEPHHACLLPSGLREGRGGPDQATDSEVLGKR